jgi:hypothetical protein
MQGRGWPRVHPAGIGCALEASKEDGPLVFVHACKLEPEGIVSIAAQLAVSIGAIAGLGQEQDPDAPAVRREVEGDWRRWLCGLLFVRGAKIRQRRPFGSLYERANGYTYDAVKIFMPAGAKKPVYAPYREHVPPDTTAAIFWLKNRDPAHWRDAWQLEHVTGKYIISDKPMSEEQWIKERAVVVDGDDAVDVTPQLEDKSLSSVLSQNNGKSQKWLHRSDFRNAGARAYW